MTNEHVTKRTAPGDAPGDVPHGDQTRTSICIDLKSFYASVECVERGLDPMTTNLVVADKDRSKGTICLAVTPAMKAIGVKNRCRVYEIPESVEYITAVPRMQLYVDYAARIFGIYLEFFSKDDIYVYSIDEAFIDITSYLPFYGLSARALAKKVMDTVLERTGIRATCGIGTNLYLTKIALDITAKHAEDFIGYLDEESYRKKLWDHRPLTDFWRIGAGTARTLERYGIVSMRGIAEADEDLLYRLFGIDAELLIDHAWGIEPVTMKDIKAYRPKSNSLSSGQVLMRDYAFEEGELIVKEMADLLCLDLSEKGLVTDSMTLTIGYSHTYLDQVGAGRAPAGNAGTGAKTLPVNRYGGAYASGTVSLPEPSDADVVWVPALAELYREITDPDIPIRRVNISANKVAPETYHQYSLFGPDENVEKNRKMQKAVLEIKKKFGKNAILKGMNLEDAATTRERNRQIGGHKSGE